MPSDKKRLYIALYPSGVVDNEERKYHWGFLVGPKSEKKAKVPGMRYHVKNRPNGWIYEEVALENVRSTNTLLARVLIAKIEDNERLVQILRSVPVVQNDPNWRCRSWVADALASIESDGAVVGKAVLDWETIEYIAREYVASKIALGRYNSGDMRRPKPTWDMLEEKETTP
ncbi:hypothetical protein BGZ63DRAFT_368375 [Mariannaea sp. PMI_226]|nr:hypothetical protein BGZ63DRAFT_368375 [Mariannaea sp. PMI_226]